MSGKLDDDDRRYLRMAVELSRSYRDDARRWPFGAVLVSQGEILGQGFNQVVELRDPSAHAEIMALRTAGRALGLARIRGQRAVQQQRAVPDVSGRLLLGIHSQDRVRRDKP